MFCYSRATPIIRSVGPVESVIRAELADDTTVLERQLWRLTDSTQETMNFWRQTTHIMSYFREENFRGDKRLPSNFMTGFLEVGSPCDEQISEFVERSLTFSQGRN